MREQVNELCRRAHQANAKWWVDPHTGNPLVRNVGEMLMLVTSELAEAMEYHRKSHPGHVLMDDKLPQYPGFDVEIIDALIRLFDIAGALVQDPGQVFEDKMLYNSIRLDHRAENRLLPGGKRY